MPQLTEQTHESTLPAQDFLPIDGTDHIEFYVGNAKQAAYFYRAALGFHLVAYRGPETGTRDQVVLRPRAEQSPFCADYAPYPRRAKSPNMSSGMATALNRLPC